MQVTLAKNTKIALLFLKICIYTKKVVPLSAFWKINDIKYTKQ